MLRLPSPLRPLETLVNYFANLFASKPLARPGAEELLLHYYRPDGDYQGWELWVWHGAMAPGGKAFPAAGEDSHGIYFRIPKPPTGDEPLGFLVRRGEWVQKEGNDRFYLPVMGNDLFLLSHDSAIYTQPPDLTLPLSAITLESPSRLRVHFPMAIKDWRLNNDFFQFFDPHGRPLEILDQRLIPEEAGHSSLAEVAFRPPVILTRKDFHLYRLGCEGFRPTPLKIGDILYDPQYYSDKDLGCTLVGGKYFFRLFAPTAVEVYVRLYEDEKGEEFKNIRMEEDENGVWAVALGAMNVEGKYYRFFIRSWDFPTKVERLISDPYSRCHVDYAGRSLIFSHQSSLRIPIHDAPVFDRSEAIIYETHIRDFSIHPESGILHLGGYLGFTEEGTHCKDNPMLSTGLAHLQELGVNVIQLMPIFDFQLEKGDKGYNWGYMPWSFFCPHAGYASDGVPTSRILEFKQLVSALHRHGFKVVLDVVFNHTAENPLEGAVNLNGAVPGYYYRRSPDGQFFNGSGCGNEFKSESPMGRKLILDSLKYWVTEFKIDGFRFDLLGLMDYTTFTMIEKQLTLLNPDILLYGEPWAGGEAGISVLGKGFQKGMRASVFNDHFRNALVGSVFKAQSGFLERGTGLGAVKAGILGGINEFAHHPLESINYFTCHDNRTLFDKLKHNDPGLELKEIQRMAKMAATILFVSQGIPFLLAGEEFLRSKKGHDNSYNAPDEINRLDWPAKGRNLDLFKLYSDLIRLRKRHRLLRLRTREQVLRSITFLDEMFAGFPAGILAWQIENPGEADESLTRLVICVNPLKKGVKFEVPAGDYHILLDNYLVSLKKGTQKKLSGTTVSLPPGEALILGEYRRKDANFGLPQGI